jgi:hypothetical protein
MQPLPLGSSVRDDNLTLTSDLTNTDIFHDEHTGISIMVGIATVCLNLLRRPKSFVPPRSQRFALSTPPSSSEGDGGMEIRHSRRGLNIGRSGTVASVAS